MITPIKDLVNRFPNDYAPDVLESHGCDFRRYARRYFATREEAKFRREMRACVSRGKKN